MKIIRSSFLAADVIVLTLAKRNANVSLSNKAGGSIIISLYEEPHFPLKHVTRRNFCYLVP